MVYAFDSYFIMVHNVNVALFYFLHIHYGEKSTFRKQLSCYHYQEFERSRHEDQRECGHVVTKLSVINERMLIETDLFISRPGVHLLIFK